MTSRQLSDSALKGGRQKGNKWSNSSTFPEINATCHGCGVEFRREPSRVRPIMFCEQACMFKHGGPEVLRKVPKPIRMSTCHPARKHCVRGLCRECYRRTSEYGISVEELHALQKNAENRCSICMQDKELTIDHDHSTGKIRGLICYECNWALGLFKDSIASLLNAATYLQMQ